jgi:hypothetical protein
VKEGSPFEEELLVDYLNGIEINEAERSEISYLIKSLAYFGYIDESVKIHKLAEQLMVLTKKDQLTIEQELIIAQVPFLKEAFP